MSILKAMDNTNRIGDLCSRLDHVVIRVIFILFCFTSVNVTAEPTVLGKEPNIVSADKYQGFVKYKLKQAEEVKQGVKPVDRDFSNYAFSLENLLPITSALLSPGYVERREGIENSHPRPLCLIGADQYSLEWLIAVKQTLLDIGAVCMIVQVDTSAELIQLKNVLEPVPWQLASGDYLAQYHGITHYPVLISKKAIEQ